VPRPTAARRLLARRRVAVTAAAAGLLLLAACGDSPTNPTAHELTPTSGHTATTTTSGPTTSTTTGGPTTSTTSSTTSTTFAYGAPPWTVLSQDPAGVAVEEQKVTVPSGQVATLVRFDAGRVVFDLHIGSQDPPVNLASIPADRGPAIAADEAPFLLAAFNGGFKIHDGPGGVEQQGQVIAPLSDGKASFVIDVDGTAHVGVWGSQLPLPGEQVASVRQNLAPLVTAGVTNPAVNNPSDWGATLTSSKLVPRSGAGEDARGDIIFAGGMALLPSDLSAALVDAGAVNAMQLDINPEWVQLDAAAAEGAPLATQIPGQVRPYNQYVSGWTRDFFVVMGPIVTPRLRPR
jgi:hypothetical protein